MMLNSLLFSSLTAVSFFSSLSSGSLTLVNDWAKGPTAISMYVSVPKPTAGAPIIVLLHGCGESAAAYYAASRAYETAAQQKGYILIYPQTTFDSHCWDVATAKSLKHDGGGDSQSITNMVKYAVTKYNGDAKKVFVTGSSSGGMMTSVLCGAYPDVFAGGAPFSGVGYGCLSGSKGSSPFSDTSPCTKGGVTKTSKEWGDLVRSAFTGYTGQRPKMSVWHGTADGIVKPHTYDEAMKQWSDVLAQPFAKNVSNDPQARYTKMVYGDGTQLVGYVGAGVGHVVPQHPKQVLEFWGI
ncbi:PHB depolymerase family esterase [Microthyrium microscopicum]|uniref:Carboxylic ester hydrolase n=1 Tax=Microthyrium microscopicum TaxID=703497 RepID=A0A6A6U726_9PEZI|nr:PHB depolymerase family esterase [Microthyrium microscopicum]